MSNSRAIDETLDDMRERVDARVRSGEYESANDVIHAGLLALEREEAMRDEIIRRRIQASIDDPRPSVPLEEVFDRLERKHAARLAAAARDA